MAPAAKRVLVTGGTGFVGVPVVQRLLARRAFDVTVATRDPASLRQRLGEGQYAALGLDVLDPRSWRDLDLSSYAAMLHLAWGQLGKFDSSDHINLHFPAHRSFLAKAVADGVASITVTGTCLEYGLRGGCLHEDFPTDPVTQYGLAKDRLRRSLVALGAERSFALKWIRLFYLHGPGQRPTSLLAQLDAAIARGDDHFNMSQGTQLRDYLHVHEAADRIVKIFEHATFEGIINCASGEPIEVRRLVEDRLKERGARMELCLAKFSYPKYEPAAFWADNGRLLRVMQESVH
jgi:dTDP-6-deoxy-L-talose 4-dehydrogenase (NAD+)